MNPVEHQAATADALRQFAIQNDSPLLAEFADAIEKNLSDELTASYEGAQEGPSEAQQDRYMELAAKWTGCDVFMDELPTGDVCLEVWGFDDMGLRVCLREEVVNREGETS